MTPLTDYLTVARQLKREKNSRGRYHTEDLTERLPTLSAYQEPTC